MFDRQNKQLQSWTKIKWNSKPPSPPPPKKKKSRMKPRDREGQKRAIFPSLIWGEGGQGFPFILSKIVGQDDLAEGKRCACWEHSSHNPKVHEKQRCVQ